MTENPTRENLIFFLAQRPEKVFEHFDEMVNKFERGIVSKSNKPQKNDTVPLSKKPELPYSSIKDVMNLSDERLIEVFSSVSKGRLTIAEMNASARECKVLDWGREYLQQETGAAWGKIKEVVGDDAVSDKELKKYMDPANVKLKGRSMPEFPSSFVEFTAKLCFRMSKPVSKIHKYHHGSRTAVIIPLDNTSMNDILDHIVDVVFVDCLKKDQETASDVVSSGIKAVLESNLTHRFSKLGLVVLCNPRHMTAIQRWAETVQGYVTSNWKFLLFSGLEPGMEKHVPFGWPEKVCGVLHIVFGHDFLPEEQGSNVMVTDLEPKDFWEDFIVKHSAASDTVLGINMPGIFASSCLFCSRNCFAFVEIASLNKAREQFDETKPKGTLFNHFPLATEEADDRAHGPVLAVDLLENEGDEQSEFEPTENDIEVEVDVD